MSLTFLEYMSEAAKANIEPPDFVRLTREKPSPKASFFECDDYELLGYYPIINKENKYLSTNFVRISTSEEQKATPFPEIIILDNFKMETAYFVPAKWKDLKTCFNSLVAEFAWDDWCEHYSDSDIHANLPDFLRITRTEDDGYMDFLRDGYKFKRIAYEPGSTGGAILPLTDEFAETLQKDSTIKIFVASFDDQSKETRTSNRFK